MTVYFGHHS